MPDQKQHNKELIAAHRTRLRVLEVQIAKYGIDAPAHILTEYDSIRAQLIALGVVDNLTPDDLPDDPRFKNNTQRIHIMLATIQATVREFAQMKASITRDLSTEQQATRAEIIDIRKEVKKDIKDARDETRQASIAIDQKVDAAILRLRNLFIWLLIGVIIFEVVTTAIMYTIIIFSKQ